MSSGFDFLREGDRRHVKKSAYTIIPTKKWDFGRRSPVGARGGRRMPLVACPPVCAAAAFLRSEAEITGGQATSGTRFVPRTNWRALTIISVFPPLSPDGRCQTPFTGRDGHGLRHAENRPARRRARSQPS